MFDAMGGVKCEVVKVYPLLPLWDPTSRPHTPHPTPLPETHSSLDRLQTLLSASRPSCTDTSVN